MRWLLSLCLFFLTLASACGSDQEVGTDAGLSASSPLNASVTEDTLIGNGLGGPGHDYEVDRSIGATLLSPLESVEVDVDNDGGVVLAEIYTERNATYAVHHVGGILAAVYSDGTQVVRLVHFSERQRGHYTARIGAGSFHHDSVEEDEIINLYIKNIAIQTCSAGETINPPEACLIDDKYSYEASRQTGTYQLFFSNKEIIDTSVVVQFDQLYGRRKANDIPTGPNANLIGLVGGVGSGSEGPAIGSGSGGIDLISLN